MSDTTDKARNSLKQGGFKNASVLALIAQAEALDRIADALERGNANRISSDGGPR